MAWTSKQYEALHKALLSAFPDYGALQRMLRFTVGWDLPRIAPRTGMEEVVDALLRRAEAEGALDALVKGAHEQNSGNPELAMFYQSYFGASPLKQHTASAQPPARGLSPSMGKLKLVIAYAPKESAHAAALVRHLSGLVIETPWTEAQIRGGDVREAQIEKAWSAADVLVLLISADFLFANQDDLARAKKCQSAGATLLPVIVRPCYWQGSDVGKLQIYPRAEDGAVKPLSKWEHPEEAWLSVLDAILSIIKARNESV